MTYRAKIKQRIRIIITAAIAVCTVVSIISAAMTIFLILEYKECAGSYDALRQNVVDLPEKPDAYMAEPPEDSRMPPSAEDLAPADLTDDKPAGIIAPIRWPSVDFNALRMMNPDITAWLVCDGTVIDYPVVQGEDNYMYLAHLFNGTPNKAGCLFVDAANAPGFTDRNTIIYGHNMKDGTMFSALVRYKEQAYYDAYPRMLLITTGSRYMLEPFAGCIVKADSDVWKRNFADDAEFAVWIESARGRSSFQSDVNVDSSDRVMTLSTCTYEFDNARYVVICKLTPASGT